MDTLREWAAVEPLQWRAAGPARARLSTEAL